MPSETCGRKKMNTDPNYTRASRRRGVISIPMFRREPSSVKSPLAAPSTGGEKCGYARGVRVWSVQEVCRTATPENAIAPLRVAKQQGS